MPRPKKSKTKTKTKTKAESAKAESAETESGETEGPTDLSSLQKIFEATMQAEKARPALQWVDVECPHCGEEFEVRVDPAEEDQEMIQDCQVCCKPIQMAVEVEDGEVTVSAYRE
ncbi:MAG: CPXCG motif-containing cysteine-rich protein [Elusimicrobiota bacterium]